MLCSLPTTVLILIALIFSTASGKHYEDKSNVETDTDDDYILQSPRYHYSGPSQRQYDGRGRQLGRTFTFRNGPIDLINAPRPHRRDRLLGEYEPVVPMNDDLHDEDSRIDSPFIPGLDGLLNHAIQGETARYNEGSESGEIRDDNGDDASTINTIMDGQDDSSDEDDDYTLLNGDYPPLPDNPELPVEYSGFKWNPVERRWN